MGGVSSPCIGAAAPKPSGMSYASDELSGLGELPADNSAAAAVAAAGEDSRSSTVSNCVIDCSTKAAASFFVKPSTLLPLMDSTTSPISSFPAAWPVTSTCSTGIPTSGLAALPSRTPSFWPPPRSKITDFPKPPGFPPGRDTAACGTTSEAPYNSPPSSLPWFALLYN